MILQNVFDNQCDTWIYVVNKHKGACINVEERAREYIARRSLVIMLNDNNIIDLNTYLKLIGLLEDEYKDVLIVNVT